MKGSSKIALNILSFGLREHKESFAGLYRNG